NNGIRFTGVASTRRMCTPAAMEVEDKMLELLNNINAFRILDNNRVALFATPSEHHLIVIKRK
ncbi:MAG: META domain-containing protein, partial [Muribaculaceae bacterium]|nr:META domain-containing protein [Muribaculaceae bacterium]